jgi:hypothetical protein
LPAFRALGEWALPILPLISGVCQNQTLPDCGWDAIAIRCQNWDFYSRGWESIGLTDAVCWNHNPTQKNGFQFAALDECWSVGWMKAILSARLSARFDDF